MAFVVFLWDDALSHRGSAAKIPWKTCKKKGSSLWSETAAGFGAVGSQGGKKGAIGLEILKKEVKYLYFEVVETPQLKRCAPQQRGSSTQNFSRPRQKHEEIATEKPSYFDP